jgi:hypothetical protein
MLRVLALCCAGLIGVPAVASAEWLFAPMVGITFHGDTSLVDPQLAAEKSHLQVGGAVTLVGSGLFGVEAIMVFTPSFFRNDANPAIQLEHGRSFALMGNVVLTAPKRWTEYSLRPFVSGGLGLLRASQLDVSGALPVESNLGGYNIGAGAVGFLSQRTGLRFDLRYYSSLNRPDQGAVALGPVHLSYMTASIGVVLRR